MAVTFLKSQLITRAYMRLLVSRVSTNPIRAIPERLKYSLQITNQPTKKVKPTTFVQRCVIRTVLGFVYVLRLPEWIVSTNMQYNGAVKQCIIVRFSDPQFEKAFGYSVSLPLSQSQSSRLTQPIVFKNQIPIQLRCSILDQHDCYGNKIFRTFSGTRCLLNERVCDEGYASYGWHGTI